MHGAHVLKTWSTTQSVVALSSGEAEYYGLVRGASIGLGLQSMFQDFRVPIKMKLKSDASAAIGIARRKGLGKVRHIEVSQLWVQDMVARDKFKLIKVPGAINLSDALTKYVDSAGIEFHMTNTNQTFEQGRRKDAPEVTN